jgi:hypothetical protein
MADELKINVSVPGAKDAAQDLKGVAAAEGEVTGAAKAQGDAHGENAAGAEKDSLATEALRMRKRSLLMELAALNPELGAAGRLISELSTAESGSAMGAAILTAGVVAAAAAIEYLISKQEELTKKADKAGASLKKEADQFVEWGDAIDAARQKAAGTGQKVSSTPTPEIERAAFGIQKDLGITDEQRKRLGVIMGMGDLTHDQQVAAAKAIVAQNGLPEDPMAAYQTIKMGGGGRDADRLFNEDVARNPAAYAARKVAAAGHAVGGSERAMTQKDIEDIEDSISARENARGITHDRKDINSFILQIAQGIVSETATANFEHDYPEAMNIPVGYRTANAANAARFAEAMNIPVGYRGILPDETVGPNSSEVHNSRPLQVIVHGDVINGTSFKNSDARRAGVPQPQVQQ